ncbi:uncharacterized protein BDV14DRAFT_186687 [Aspergillus stella-maris]|uniref:uncharacterized protein n=1 Tax=Aspergillus stella-maris TaxID=1810926 RepID=UPI003CCD33D0
MRPKSHTDFAIAIICALPLEAEAVEALFDEHYDRLSKYYGKQRGDANAYINGRIGKHDVVLCYMPGMGKRNAASVASSLRVSYTEIELALVVGICGGAPPPPRYQEIFLGDVIISDSVIEYDFGRQYPGGFQRKIGPKDTLGRLSREVRSLLNGLRAGNSRSELQSQAQRYLHTLQQTGTEQTGTKWRHPGLNDMLFQASYLHKHDRPASPAGCSCCGSDSPDGICEDALGKDCDDLNCNPGHQVRCREALGASPISIYIGPVASADTVMKSGQHRDEIVRKEQVLGFEMEGAGVWDNVPCIIIKGVCDYADSHKSKAWQAYAAATGASVAKAFLEYWMPANRQDASKDRHVMIPFARNPHFMGRQEEIQEIKDMMTVPDGPGKLAIIRLGGVGKTQIALELVYRMRDREPGCSIFWVPCTSYEAVEQAYMSIAQLVGLHGVEPAEVKERLKTYFSQTNEKWVLIFNNADDMEMWINSSPTAPPLKNIIPQSANGHALFTSRNQQLALKLTLLNIRDLLQDDHVTNTLLEQLAFLPLAIKRSAIELLGEEFEDDGRYVEIQNPIQQVDKLASDYLSFMSCINPRDILEKVEALGLLKAYSFVSGQVDGSIVSLHRLTFRIWVETAAKQLDKAQQAHHDALLERIGRCLQSDGRYAEAETIAWGLEDPDTLTSISQLAWAEAMERRALQGCKKVLGPKHPDTLISVSQLGLAMHRRELLGLEKVLGPEHPDTLTSVSQLGSAEAMHRQALQGREKVLGPEHPHTLTSVSQLGWAEAMHRRDLLGSEKVLGPEHPDTLTSVSNLGSAMHRRALQGREKVLGPEHPDTLTSVSQLGSARHRQAFQGHEKVLGPEHPDTLTSMHNLAYTLKAQGNISQALGLIKECADVRNKVLGKTASLSEDLN